MALPYKSPVLKGRQFGPGPNPNVGKNSGTLVKGGPVPTAQRAARKAAAAKVMAKGA